MISVVVPLYNKELSIANTIYSALSQTFKDFEIVVVDDGSKDNSVNEVKKIYDPRIRIISQKNKGVSAARNKGIEEARFEWVAFLDGDDLWNENHLDEFIKMRELYPKEKVYVTSFKYSNGRECKGNTAKGPIYKIDSFFYEYLEYGNLVWTSTVILNKACFSKVHPFNINLKIGEDLDLWARLSKKYTIIKNNTITAIYRNEAENRSDVGNYKMENSFLFDLDFSKMDSIYEKKFYSFWIIHKLKAFIVARDIKNIFYLLYKYGLSIIKYKII